MSSTTALNPFNTGSPVDPNQFFGRERIIKEIFHFLRNKDQNTFFINGFRRIGKTSLLRKIQKEVIEHGFKAVYFDLQNKGEDSLEAVLFDLIRSIDVELEQETDISIEQLKNDISLFEQKYIPQVTKEHKIILLFDEFDVLGDRKFIAAEEKTKDLAYIRFVPFLHELIEKKVKIKFVFAIGRMLDDLAAYYGPIKKFAQKQELKYFSEDETFSLFSHVAIKNVKFSKDAIHEIFRISNGFPFFIQCLGSYLFDRATEDNKSVINKKEVQKYILPTVDKYSGGLIWFWDAFSPEEKIYLFAIAKLNQSGNVANKKNIHTQLEKLNIRTIPPKLLQALPKLLKSKIVNQISGKQSFKISIPFIQSWITTKYSVEIIKEEIDKLDSVVQSFLNAGAKLMNEESYYEAIEMFGKALKRSPYNFSAQYNLAWAYYYSKTPKHKVVEEFEKAFDLEPENAGTTFSSILKEYYEQTGEKHYLYKLLDLFPHDKWGEQKVLDFNQKKREIQNLGLEWKTLLERGDIEKFIITFSKNKWLLPTFNNEIRNILIPIIYDLFEKNKYSTILSLYDRIPGLLTKDRFYFESLEHFKERPVEVAISKSKYLDAQNRFILVLVFLVLLILIILWFF